jgi:hypothetical protein
MAVIHAAYEPGPGGGRVVALKRIVDARSSDPSARRLFLREASIAMRIEHPNVVRTYEVGEAEGESYIVMELLEGATLAELQRAARCRIPLPVALHIVAGILAGLHAAHELCGPDGKPLGLVHQDVSPQNIHVAYEGTTRLLDFGVARLLCMDASRTDAVRGKACYLAPEQLQLGKITRRVDLFAAGIVLHELITGIALFPRGQAELAYSAILSGEIPSPRSIRSELPEEVDAVARRALAVTPSARFASADEMRRALLDAQERAGVRIVDVAAVGEWVRRVVAPVWTKREIEDRLHGVSVATDVAELSTLAPLRVARVVGPGPGRGRHLLGLAVGLIVAVLGGLVVRNIPRGTAIAATVSTRAAVVATADGPTPSTPPLADPPVPMTSPTERTQMAAEARDVSRSASSGDRQKRRPHVAVGGSTAPSSAPAPSSDPLATQ